MAKTKYADQPNANGGATMNQHTQKLNIKTQAGLSLVELMVTLVLSLFIMLVSTAFYVNNKTTYRFIDSSTDVQENGRYAIHFLRESIANAGFPMIDESFDSFPTAAAERPIDGAGNTSDRISVSYQSQLDCLGAPVPVVAGAQITTSVFAVDGANNLTCNNVQLIPGVENIQVEYGVDTDADGIPNNYQNATQVQTGSTWANVVVVRLAVLVTSQIPVRDQASQETYQLLGVSHTAANDRLHRRVFTTTIPLRNTGA